MTVIDVSEAEFRTEVLERSSEVPVVVDFWAPWCGPCRQLGPALEKAAEAREGKVVLVDGEVADEFVGAKPPSQVEAFFDRLVPSENEILLQAGDEESLRKIIEKEPANVDANFALAQIHYRNGELDAALERLRNVSGNFLADGLAARIELEREEDPQLLAAFEALDDLRLEEGIDALLAALTDGRLDKDGRERVRKVVVAVLDALGVEHPLARETRRRLAAALY
jgi:putative thioredoxin